MYFVSVNPLYSGGFSHTNTCIKDGIVHYIYIRGHKLKFPNYDVFKSLKIVLTSTKSVDPGEMQHYAAFHLGLHFLLSTPLGVSRIQSVNVW